MLIFCWICFASVMYWLKNRYSLDSENLVSLHNNLLLKYLRRWSLVGLSVLNPNFPFGKKLGKDNISQSLSWNKLIGLWPSPGARLTVCLSKSGVICSGCKHVSRHIAGDSSGSSLSSKLFNWSPGLLSSFSLLFEQVCNTKSSSFWVHCSLLLLHVPVKIFQISGSLSNSDCHSLFILTAVYKGFSSIKYLKASSTPCGLILSWKTCLSYDSFLLNFKVINSKFSGVLGNKLHTLDRSAGTLMTGPFIPGTPPRGKETILIKGIRCEINLTSKLQRLSNSGGIVSRYMKLARACAGNLPFFKLLWHVKHIHSLSCALISEVEYS